MKKLIILFIGIIFIQTISSAQFIEDALRYSQANGVITARAGGLGTSFHGVSDDFSALYFNPAGLSLIQKRELTFGFGFLRNSTETDYHDIVKNLSANDAYLSHFGIVAPFSTKSGKAAIAIGYMLEANFDNTYDFGGFNQNSTYIDYRARNDGENNMAYYLNLADINNGSVFTPVVDSLLQEGTVIENGGLHNISGGAGFDLNENVSIGFSITGKWGTYDFNREFMEKDIYNKYNQFVDDYSNVDLDNMMVEEQITQSISGITGAVGIQGRIGEYIRLGVGVKFPTFYDIEEKYWEEATASFDNGDKIQEPYINEGETSYKLTSPWIFSAGLSVHAQGITFTSGVEYSDVTQMEFSDATKKVESLNKYILRELVGQTTWGFGVEYDIPMMPFVVRGSFSSTTSPYSDDIAGATLTNLSLGGGIYLASNIRLDALFRYSDLTQIRSNYGVEESARYSYNISPLNIAMQLTYRY